MTVLHQIINYNQRIDELEKNYHVSKYSIFDKEIEKLNINQLLSLELICRLAEECENINIYFEKEQD